MPLEFPALVPPSQTHSSLGFVLATTIDAVPDLAGSCDDVAVMTAVPAFVGENKPDVVIDPSVACQLTAGLNAPVPWTVAAQLDVPVVRIDVGLQFTETDVTVLCAATVTVAVPDFVESWTEVAEMVAVPVPDGVKTPAVLTLPMLEGVTDHETLELKFPAPCTFDAQAAVWSGWMELGEQDAATDVMVGVIGRVPLPEPPPHPDGIRVAMPKECDRDAVRQVTNCPTILVETRVRHWRSSVWYNTNFGPYLACRAVFYITIEFFAIPEVSSRGD